MSAIALLVVALQALSSQHTTFGAFHRVSEKPLLMPRAGKFDNAGAFNPAVIKAAGKYVMIYRAQDTNGTSRLGYAESKDGVHFVPDEQPLLSPEADYEKDGGVEDPRLCRLGESYYLTYTGYNKTDAQLCLATSKDLRHWQRQGVIMPANKGTWNTHWTKSGAIVPQKIAGKYWMFYMGDATLHGGTDQMGLASSIDGLHWTDATDRPILPRRSGMWDSNVVEPGPPPIITKEGILLVYNGADKDNVYRTGWALFDKNDPRKVIARAAAPIFEPALAWEKEGQVPNVVFVEGMVQEGNKFRFYYGGGDTNVGLAESTLVTLGGKKNAN